MFAEITLTAAEPLPRSLEAEARAWFQRVALLKGVPSPESGGGQPEHAAGGAIVERIADPRVLLYRSSARSLKAHVELVAGKPTLRRLKEAAEEAASELAGFLAEIGGRAATLRIRIYAEGELLETGRRHAWSARLARSARTEVPGRRVVPLATFLASLSFGQDVQRAVVNAAAAVIGLVLWLLTSTTLERSEYKYE
jgi:hypothetical protein